MLPNQLSGYAAVTLCEYNVGLRAGVLWVESEAESTGEFSDRRITFPRFVVRATRLRRSFSRTLQLYQICSTYNETAKRNL